MRPWESVCRRPGRAGGGRGRGRDVAAAGAALAEVVDRKIKQARSANALVSAGFGFVWYSRPPNRTPSASLPSWPHARIEVYLMLGI